ncbi:MAG: GIY-YIG nuclease family protein [Candidatus Omnitrophica bacterium]|nr:GIY-YIG nuclease family protein [Candidatus Omnitrophota bacterium]
MNREYYFYILQCSDGTKYYGHTNDLKKRVLSHFKGQVFSTKNKRPLRLVYFEKFSSRSAVFKREMQFKSGKTRMETIEKMMGSFSQEKCQGFNSQTSLRTTTCVHVVP